MDTDSFVMMIKTDDFIKDINNDVEKQFDTRNFDINNNRPLLIGKNTKVIGKFKDELRGKITSEFCALKEKTCAYKLDSDHEEKKAKGTKKCVAKRQITFNNYVDILFNTVVRRLRVKRQAQILLGVPKRGSFLIFRSFLTF